MVAAIITLCIVVCCGFSDRRVTLRAWGASVWCASGGGPEQGRCGRGVVLATFALAACSRDGAKRGEDGQEQGIIRPLIVAVRDVFAADRRDGAVCDGSEPGLGDRLGSGAEGSAPKCRGLCAEVGRKGLRLLVVSGSRPEFRGAVVNQVYAGAVPPGDPAHRGRLHCLGGLPELLGVDWLVLVWAVRSLSEGVVVGVARGVH